MSDKKWTTSHLNGFAVITHDDYGHIPAWNEATAKGLARILNKGLSEIEALSTEAEGDAYFHGWFDGFSSKDQVANISDENRPLTNSENKIVNEAWEKHKAAKPKFNTFVHADGNTMFARNGVVLQLKKDGDPAKSINNGQDPDPSQWNVVTHDNKIY